MSVLEQTPQKPIWKDEDELHAYVEVSYSESRKNEMTREHEEHCTLLIHLLKDHLTQQGAIDVTAWTPKNRKKFADIVLEFKINNKDNLEKISQVLEHVGGSSIGKMEYFISTK